MPAQSTRAATTDTTVTTSPPAAREAKDTQPTSSAKPACSATMSCTRARPWATFAHTKLSTLEKAGAPDTSATARLTAKAGATPPKCCLTSTAAVAPSTSPRASPSSPHGTISRRKIPSASALGLTGWVSGTARSLIARRPQRAGVRRAAFVDNLAAGVLTSVNQAWFAFHDIRRHDCPHRFRAQERGAGVAVGTGSAAPYGAKCGALANA